MREVFVDRREATFLFCSLAQCEHLLPEQRLAAYL